MESSRRLISSTYLQEIDFVDIEDLPVCLREKPGHKFPFAGFHQRPEAECSHNAVLRGIQRQLDDPDISAQYGGQSADSRRLRGPPFTRDEQTADGRLYCNETERELHVALSDNGGEWISEL